MNLRPQAAVFLIYLCSFLLFVWLFFIVVKKSLSDLVMKRFVFFLIIHYLKVFCQSVVEILEEIKLLVFRMSLFVFPRRLHGEFHD
jgi:hypothetical protein